MGMDEFEIRVEPINYVEPSMSNQNNKHGEFTICRWNVGLIIV